MQSTPENHSLIADYEIVRHLDEDSMSSVALAKVLDVDTSTSSSSSVEEDLVILKYGCSKTIREVLKHEYQALKAINHPNIIRPVAFKKTIDEGKKMNILALPYRKNGDLFDLVEVKGGMSENSGRFIAKQLVSAISYLHKYNIVHRDIKLENVLIKDDFSAELIDFGFAEYRRESTVDSKEAGSRGTKQYLSPEIFMDGEVNLKLSDMFALGVTLFTMMLGTPPFMEASEGDPYYSLIMAGDWEGYWSAHPKGNKANEMKDFQDLMQKLLSFNPSYRLDSEEVEGHSWLTTTVDTERAR